MKEETGELSGGNKGPSIWHQSACKLYKPTVAGIQKLLRPDIIKSYTILLPAVMIYEDRDSIGCVATVFLMCTQLTCSLCLY